MATTTKKADAPTLTSAGVVSLLRARYNGEVHITLEEVRDAAGFSASRSCDVISIGTWPSRGLTLRGFEVKVSRADWKREIEQPHKAEAFAPYCDEWYIAAGSSKIVQLDELPETWGLLVAKGARLDLVKPAAKNKNPEPIDRGFLVALLKRAKEQGPVKSVIEAAEQRGYERGKHDGRREQPEHDPTMTQHWQKEAERLEQKIAAFERAAGLYMENFRYGDPKRLGDAVRAVLHGTTNPLRENAKYMIDQLERITTGLRQLRDMPDLSSGEWHGAHGEGSDADRSGDGKTAEASWGV